MTVTDWRPAIRALIYGLQFEGDLTHAVDHVLQTVVEKRSLGLDRDAYRGAIETALGSTERLATLIAQDHAEQAIRRFLELLRDRL